MKETQTQRPFHLEDLKTYVKQIVPSSCFSDLWVWISWIVLIKKGSAGRPHDSSADRGRVLTYVHPCLVSLESRFSARARAR